MLNTMRLALLLPAGLALAGPLAAPSAPVAADVPAADANGKFIFGRPFTENCNNWHLDVATDEVALRTVCQIQGARVTSELSLESTLIGTDVAITPSFPSGTADVPFSSVCKNCRLDPPTGTNMLCDCSSSTKNPISIDLYWWITTVKGVPCFTDGAVCAQVSVTTPEEAKVVNGTTA